MLDKAKHKTRLTQNMKAKHTSNANTQKQEKRDRISDKITWSPFPSILWKTLSF